MRPGVIGLEPTAAGELATQLQLAAEALDRMRDDLAGRIRHSSWVGHDADRVRAEWHTVHYGSLTATAHGLRDAEQRLRVEIREQEWASGSGATQPSGGVVPAGSGEYREGWELPGWFSTTVSITSGIVGSASAGIAWADKYGKLDDMGRGLGRTVKVFNALDRPVGHLSLGTDSFELGSGIAKGVTQGWTDQTTGEVVLTSVAVGAGIVGLVAASPAVITGAVVVGAGIGIAKASDDVTRWVGDSTKDVLGGVRDGAQSAFDGMTDVFSGPLAPSTVGGTIVDVVGDAPAAIGGVVDDVTSWRPW